MLSRNMLDQFRKYLAAALCCMMTLGQSTGAEDYNLQPGDLINLTVYQEADLSAQCQLDRTGGVSFPLLGTVSLKDLSLLEAEKKVKALYEKDFLVNAQVNLSVIKYVEKWVVVVGDVASPCSVACEDGKSIKLTSALTKAGGVITGADKGKVIIERKEGEVEEVELSKTEGVILLEGDLVTVRVDRKDLAEQTQRKQLTVSGMVQRPGEVSMSAKGTLDILTAIAKAGGFSKIANQKDVIVQRVSGSGHRKIEVSVKNIRNGKDPMFMLEEGDIVVVKESRF